MTVPVQLPEQHRPQNWQPRMAVGTDGSEWGDAALDWALRHASTLKARLRVYAAKTADDQAIARRLNAYRWLHAIVTSSPDAPVPLMVKASQDSDLLVLGYRGHQHGPFGVGRSILPILTATHCDTVVIRGETRAVHGDHGWITAALGGQDDRFVLHRAVQLATRTRSGLRLLHAAPLPPARHVEAGPDPAALLEHAAEQVRELAPRLTASLLLMRSQAHEAVRSAERTDLLVLGPGSHEGRLSVVTSTALHMARCPVYVVRPTA